MSKAFILALEIDPEAYITYCFGVNFIYFYLFLLILSLGLGMEKKFFFRTPPQGGGVRVKP